MSLPATSRPILGLEKRSLAYIALLCLGHITVDVHQGAVPALLPTLKEQLHLSYGEVGLILTVLSIVSSFAQPMIGYLSDISRHRWLIPGGILLAPLGMALLGVAPGYGWMLAAVLLVGLGAAAYHPEAARTAVELAGSRKGTGMAFWVVGGHIGNAFGPLYVAAVVAAGSLRHTAWSLPLGVAVAGLTLLYLRRMAAYETADRRGAPAISRADLPRTQWWGEVLLVTAVVLRTTVQTGLVVFLPFYYVEVLGGPAGHRELLQSLLLFGSVPGTLLGGPLADRFGLKKVILGSFVLVLPLVPAVLFLTGLPAFILLFLIGSVQASTATLATVLGQQYMPRYASVSAGLTIGFALGMGGVCVGLLGWVADLWGIATAAYLLAILPLIGLGLAAMLPRPPRMTPAAVAAATV